MAVNKIENNVKPYKVRYNKKYYGCFETLEEAEEVEKKIILEEKTKTLKGISVRPNGTYRVDITYKGKKYYESAFDKQEAKQVLRKLWKEILGIKEKNIFEETFFSDDF